MKKSQLILIAAVSLATAAHAGGTCQVKVCNKLERYSLSPSNWVSDWMGKTCFDTIVPREKAKKGAVLDSKTKWYQGSFNPTKKSVTRVAKVYRCD